MNLVSIPLQHKTIWKRLVCGRLQFLSCFLLAICCWSMPEVQAQSSSALLAVYGRGVHAYFAGDTARAEQYFTQVIQAGSSDPRPYYFRAMLRLNSGQQFEAENDMRVGAAYEARNPGVERTIGRALQRVQGPGRRTLEKFRRQARLDRVIQGQQRTRQRYEQLEQRGPAVLRHSTPVPLGQTVQPPQLAPAPPQPAAGSGAKPDNGSATKPKPAGSATKPGGSATKPSGSSGTKGSDTKDSADIFGDTPTPAPAEDDPFGDKSGSGAKPDASSTKSDASGTKSSGSDTKSNGSGSKPEEADPFGGDSDSASATEDGDPFGESDTASEDSSAQESSSEADDLFGDDPPASNDAKEADSSEEDTSDPFGDDAPSDDAEDDPFGESTESESEEKKEEPTPEEEDDGEDPFGPFGASSPASNRSKSKPVKVVQAASATDNPVVGQLFSSLGRWIATRSSNPSAVRRLADVQPGVVTPTNFEFGPTSDSKQVKTTAMESKAEEDLFGDEPSVFSDDATVNKNEGSDSSSAVEPVSGIADPFGDDPFGEL